MSLRIAMLLSAMMAVGLSSETLRAQQSPPGKTVLADGSRQIVFRMARSDDEDPFAAGKAAAAELKRKLGDLAPKAVLVGESFEGSQSKAQVIQGVVSVFPAALVVGGSTYGGFDQDGVAGGESVVVSAFTRHDVDIQPVCVEEDGYHRADAGKRRRGTGEEAHHGGHATGRQDHGDRNRLLVVIADAHSPKNGPLVQGIRSVLGPAFPVTGGSVNRNTPGKASSTGRARCFPTPRWASCSRAISRWPWPGGRPRTTIR